jgi:uncharacterized membrane protein HdeD (DUF308 family)
VNTISIVSALIVGVALVVSGIAKVLAMPVMRAAAAHHGLTVTQYRIVGALELAGVVGLIAGFALSPLGIAAAIGIILLMLGAAAAHLKERDPLPRVLFPLLVAGIAAAYLVTID